MISFRCVSAAVGEGLHSRSGPRPPGLLSPRKRGNRRGGRGRGIGPQPGRGLGTMPIAPHFLFIEHLRCGGQIRVAKKGQEVVSWGVGLCVAVAPPRTASLAPKQVSGSVGLSEGMKRRGWPLGGYVHGPLLRVRAQHGSPPRPTSQRLLTPPGPGVACPGRLRSRPGSL